jgi:hypothetical protein
MLDIPARKADDPSIPHRQIGGNRQQKAKGDKSPIALTPLPLVAGRAILFTMPVEGI